VAAAAAAVAAAERLELEQELAALTLSVQSDKKRAQSGALRMQQVQAQLGVPPAAPAPPGRRGDYVRGVLRRAQGSPVLPCKHLCVCGECVEQLTKTRTPMCPVCRGPIRETIKVFCS
jgi:hypothetical protein